MTSQSVLESVQIFRLGNFLWQIITLIDYTYKKKECLKLFKAAEFKTVISSRAESHVQT